LSGIISYDVYRENIGMITLNRPEAANALNRPLLTSLKKQLDELNEDSSLRCLLLTGEGIKAFSAGADLKEREKMSDEEVTEFVQQISDVVSTIENMKVPTIAVMNGIAYGGGLELALGCDLRIAAEDIKVGLPETSLGIIPGAGGTQRLTRLIGIGHTKKLIFSAKPIFSPEAHALGIIEEITERHHLFTNALHLAETIAYNAPIAIQQAKLAINEGMHMSIHEGLKVEQKCYQQTIPTKDRLEGLRAFKERRTPIYKGK